MAVNPLQWDEVGKLLGSHLLGNVELITATAKEAFQDAPFQDTLPDFDGLRWRQELSVFVMFWWWQVANSPKLQAAGATRPMLFAYYQTCVGRLEAAGLVGEDFERWEEATHGKWKEYAATWLQEGDANRPPTIFTGTVGWRFCRCLFPEQEPDPRLAIFMHEIASGLFLEAAKFIQSLEKQYGTLG